MIISTFEVRSTMRQMIPRNVLWHFLLVSISFLLVAFVWIQVNPQWVDVPINVRITRRMHANAEPVVKNHSSWPVLRVVGRRAISAAACCWWLLAVDFVRSLRSKVCWMRHNCLSRSGKWNSVPDCWQIFAKSGINNSTMISWALTSTWSNS